MAIYIFLIIIALLLLGLRHSLLYRNNILRNLTIVIVVIILFLLTIFRSSSVGTDYMAYHGYFYSSNVELRMQYIENGYILLNYLSQTIGLFIIIPTFEFLISFGGMYSLAKSSACNLFSFLSLYILTYTYMQSFNALRQFIAIGFVSFGCAFLMSNRKRKLIWFFIFIFLASEFHSSSWIMLLTPLLMNISVTDNKVLLSGIITILLFVTGIGLKITQPLIMMNSHYAIKYSDSTSFLTAAGNKGIIQFLPAIIQFTIFFIYCRINKVKMTDVEQKRTNSILAGYLFFLVLYSAGGNGVVDRIQMYFFVFCVIANCFFVDNIKTKSASLSLLYQLSVIMFWVIYCILRLSINNANVVPYVFG